jgi:hypothetical protein
MLYDPRELAQELEEQGNTVQPGPGKDGNEGPFYWITLPDGTQCGLSAEEMQELKNQGKLNAAGILEHDAKIKGRDNH